MRGLHNRIASLEALNTGTGWRAILDAMSLADLERLESLLLPLGGGKVTGDWVAALSDDDAGFLASIIARREGMLCAG